MAQLTRPWEKIHSCKKESLVPVKRAMTKTFTHSNIPSPSSLPLTHSHLQHPSPALHTTTTVGYLNRRCCSTWPHSPLLLGQNQLQQLSSTHHPIHLHLLHQQLLHTLTTLQAALCSVCLYTVLLLLHVYTYLLLPPIILYVHNQSYRQNECALCHICCTV